MARGLIILMALLGLAACAHEPMDYIPPSDRTLLQAQARMGEGNNGQPPISVDQMLRQARGQATGPADPQRLVVQFSGDAVTLTDDQRQALDRFAAKAGAATVVVSGRRGSFADNAALLAQRRTVAVAHSLSALPNVEVRFVPDLPDSLVVVGTGTSGLQTVQP